MDPPVGIRGRPYMDFLVSGRTGCSQLCRDGVVENERVLHFESARADVVDGGGSFDRWDDGCVDERSVVR